MQPKDLSLILEIETPRVPYQKKLPGFPEGGSEGPSEVSIATSDQNLLFYFRHMEMLKQKYGGRSVVIVNGNETDDQKTRFYVEPAIRGQRNNITWGELKVLYPNCTPHQFPISKEKDRDRIYATA